MNRLAILRNISMCFLCTTILFLTGCGGGGGSSSKSETPPATSAATSVSSTTTSTSSATTSVSTTSSSSVKTSSSSTTTSSSSSSSSTASVINTNYKVSVNIPASFPNNDGTANETNVALNSKNFALVSVSLSGVVIERYDVKASDVTKDTKGNWNIKAPVNPRADTVIVADITKNIDLPTTDNINKDGLVYAPITAERVDIDVASTSAYKNLISELGGTGTFKSQNIDPTATQQINAVENLVNNIQNSTSAQTYEGKTTVAEALAVIDAPVKAIVKEEIVNIKNPATGSTASLIRDEGGLFWYDADLISDEVFERGSITNTVNTDEVYDGTKFIPRPANEILQNYIFLGTTGWALESGNAFTTGSNSIVQKYNDDGSVVMRDAGTDGDSFTLSISQSFDLSGRNILDFLSKNSNTSAMTSIVNPTTMFASGAKGYRFLFSFPKRYAIYYEAGDENGKCWGGDALASATGGNCTSVSMTVDVNGWENGVSGLNKLYSMDVAPSTTGFRAVNLGNIGANKLIAQILNDANKTVKFYEQSWSGDYSKLLATSTWSEIILPNLISDNKAIHFDYPDTILTSGVFWSGDVTGETFVQQNGYLRGIIILPASTETDTAVHFNITANNNLNTALNYTNPLVGSWGNGSLVFLNNVQYLQAQADNSSCIKGIEFGSYTWNPVLGKFSTSTVYDGNDDCGLSDSTLENPANLKLDAGKISIENGAYILAKTPSVANSIIGTWITGDLDNSEIAITFTATNYLLSDYGGDSGSGLEYGTYSYNSGTGSLDVNISLDTDGDAGLSDVTNRIATINGDTLTILCSDCGTGVVFKRVK